MGTKTQSTVDMIGLKKNSKLNTYNPFLDLTDDQLCKLFDSSKKKMIHIHLKSTHLN